jgi:glycosyltransferase involved in cell wall biosynthesis
MIPSIGAVVLTRDEERCVGRCLSSVLAFGFDDILVVDTGSVDGTVGIVRGHGPRVRLHTSAWSDSFAAARNVGLDMIRTDWAMFVDADEWLVRGSASALREHLAQLSEAAAPTVALAPRIVDVTRGSVVDGVPRILHTGPRVRYHGRVHEYPIVDGDIDSPVEIMPVDLELLHDGYAPDVLRAKDKHRRNMELLRAEIVEDPDNPRWPFYAVRDGAPLLSATAITDLCRHSARLAGAESAPGGEAARTYYRDTLINACYAMTARGRWDSVSSWCDELDELSGASSPDAQYFRAVVAVMNGWVGPDELRRTAAVREDEAICHTSGICRSGDHLDAATALLIEHVHGADAADEYRHLIDSWTDMFFLNSRLRRNADEKDGSTAGTSTGSL